EERSVLVAAQLHLIRSCYACRSIRPLPGQAEFIEAEARKRKKLLEMRLPRACGAHPCRLLHNPRERVHFEARPADKRPIDPLTRHELRDVLRRDTAAV